MMQDRYIQFPPFRSSHLLLVTLLRPLLPPLLLKHPNPLNTLLAPHAILPLRPFLEHTPNPRCLANLGHSLEQISHLVLVTVALLQHEIHVPNIALLGKGIDKAFEDRATAL